MADDVPSGGSLERLAQELKNERISRGLSVDDMSRIVNISTPHIEKVESGDFSFLPPLYVFAILRKYASELGMDDEQMLARCRNELQAPDLPTLVYAPPRETGEAGGFSTLQVPKAGRFRLIVILAAVLIIVIALLAWLLN